MVEFASPVTRTYSGIRFSALVCARCLVAAAAALSGVYWSTVAMGRWRNFEAGAFDLGLFDQLLWNTAHGRIFETTFLEYNYLGEHFPPVLLLLAPAYHLGAGPAFLLAVQAVGASAAAVLLFEAARTLRLPLPVALAATLAYLVNPYLHGALLYDFHPETLVVLPASAAIWAAAAGRHRWALAATLSVLLFKEDAVFVALALAGVMWALGGRREAAMAVGGCVVYAVVVIFVLMPFVRDGHPQELTDRYPALFGGRTGLEGLAWLASHPVDLVREVFSGAHVRVMAVFVAASALVGLAAPRGLLLLLPALLVPVLSSHYQQAVLHLHYAVELVPLALVAVLLGARRLSGLPPSVVAAAVLLPAIVGAVLLSPVGSRADNGLPETRRAAVMEALALVPEDASVAAQSGLAPDLAQRVVITEFPGGWEHADWVVVDLHGFRTDPVVQAGYEDALEALRERYVEVYDRDGVQVFRRPT